MYGVSGLLIPASLSTALTITEGGYINVRNNVIESKILMKYIKLK
jgi:cytochrome d ubiquinol oxidase subunit II